MERTSRRLCPVMVAISASVHPASANRGSSQVIEGDSDNASFGTCLPPARAESIRCPGFALRRRQYESALLWGCIQCDLERRTDRNNDPGAGLRLLEPDVLSVI